MQRRRSIAGPPQRAASAAWGVVEKLITDTLANSENIAEADVVGALASLRGIGPALIAAGHLESTPVVLVSGPLHVSVTVLTGTAALSVEENLSPVPGGRNAQADWVLYLPSPSPFAAVLAAAADKSVHLSVETPPDEALASDDRASAEGLIDVAALGRLGGSR